MSIRTRKDVAHHEMSIFDLYVITQVLPILDCQLRADHFIACPALCPLWEEARRKALRKIPIDALSLCSSYLSDDDKLLDEIQAESHGNRGLATQSEAKMIENSAMHAAVMAARDFADRAEAGEIDAIDAPGELQAIQDLYTDCVQDFSRSSDDIIAELQGDLTSDTRRIYTMPMPVIGDDGYEFQSGKAYLFAARTSGFKTTIMSMALEVTGNAGHPGLFCTLEDDEGIIKRDLVRAEPGLTYKSMRKHWSKEDFAREMAPQFIPAAVKVCNRKLRIATDILPIDLLLIRIRRAVHRHGIQIVAIDFLQALPLTPGLPEHTHLAECSKKIAAMAKELNIVVLVGSQLTQEATRRTESEDGRLPDLGDVRGGQAICASFWGVWMHHVPRTERTGNGRPMKILLRKLKDEEPAEFDAIAHGGRDTIELGSPPDVVIPIHSQPKW